MQKIIRRSSKAWRLWTAFSSTGTTTPSCRLAFHLLWDTAIACNALLDSGLPVDDPALIKAGEWMLKKQIENPGDWSVKNPHTEPGGWPFEFYNELYPDTDDTAEILIALDRIAIPDHRWKHKESQRALTWLLSMQSKNGGWGAFDQDNDKEILNEIPFADHKALLDPPTVDVSSRILWCLGRLGFKRDHPTVLKALEFVKSNQEPDGCWWGRWGVNYIYGTFLALNGQLFMGEDMKRPCYRQGFVLAGKLPERGRRLGGNLRELPETGTAWAGREHCVANRVGDFRIGRGRQSQKSGYKKGCRIFIEVTKWGRHLVRGGVHRNGFPRALLYQIPYVPALFPADGFVPLPQPPLKEKGRVESHR